MNGEHKAMRWVEQKAKAVVGAASGRISARSARCVAGCVAALALAGASGCAPVQPYERGKLAHPTMSAADMASFGEGHLRAISEGATGGSGGTGSGCGCN